MKLPPWSVLRWLPSAWLALRKARHRLAHSAQRGLQLEAQRDRRRAVPVPVPVLATAVFGLGRRMRGCACLAQAIALANLLRKAGLPAQVVVGAARADERFRAHAWVECEGRSLDPQVDQLGTFTALRNWGSP